MLVSFFVALFGGSIALLFSGIKFKRWVFTLGGTILSIVCALQGFMIEVVSGGVTIIFKEIAIVLFCWVMVFVGTVFTAYGFMNSLSSGIDNRAGGPTHAG